MFGAAMGRQGVGSYERAGAQVLSQRGKACRGKSGKEGGLLTAEDWISRGLDPVWTPVNPRVVLGRTGPQ